MASYVHILATYSSIAVKSGQMLEAAKNNDWDRLIALEHDCRTLAETLQRVEDGGSRPDAAYLARKAELIRRVLADDAEIRKLTEPWMCHLAAYLGSARQENKLRRAYETDNGV